MPERFPLGPVLEKYGIHFRDMDGFQKVQCPVHDERRPSCSVSLSTAYFECHACGARGGAIDIVQAREGLDRASALALTEVITGVGRADLRPESSEQSSRRVPQGQGFRPRYSRQASPRLHAGRTPWL